MEENRFSVLSSTFCDSCNRSEDPMRDVPLRPRRNSLTLFPLHLPGRPPPIPSLSPRPPPLLGVRVLDVLVPGKEHPSGRSTSETLPVPTTKPSYLDEGVKVRQSPITSESGTYPTSPLGR